jgi:hypothetical protein
MLTQQSWTESLLSRKRAPVPIHNTLAARSVGPHLVSLPQTTIEAVEKAKHLLMKRLHRFTRPISPACDQNVQYLLTEANPSVLSWFMTSIKSRGAHGCGEQWQHKGHKVFRQVQTSMRIITLHPMIMVYYESLGWDPLYPSFYMPRG